MRDAIRAVRPGLRIGVPGESEDLRRLEGSPVDFYLRPKHFYTDRVGIWHRHRRFLQTRRNKSRSTSYCLVALSQSFPPMREILERVS